MNVTNVQVITLPILVTSVTGHGGGEPEQKIYINFLLKPLTNYRCRRIMKLMR